MHFYFTPEGMRRLQEEVDRIAAQVEAAAQQMGDACNQGGDTYHDNFAYEQGVRDHGMWSHRLRDLRAILRAASVVEPQPNGTEVMFGRTVKFEDLDTREVRTITIGSYMVFVEGQEISYMSPLALILRGGMTDEIREGAIGETYKRFRIVEVR